FVQIDGWPPEKCDSVIADCGGYGLTGSDTWELMSGAPCVRVLIVPGTDPDLVYKILLAAARFYDHDRPGIEYGSPESACIDQATIDDTLARTDIVELIMDDVALKKGRDK